MKRKLMAGLAAAAATLLLANPIVLLAVDVQDGVVSTPAMAEPQKASTTAELRALYERNKANWPQHLLACFPRTSMLCIDGKCERQPMRVLVLVGNQPSVTLYRCDAAGCDDYPADQSSSGKFMNLQPVQPRGFLLKIDLPQMRYVEMLTLETRAVVNHGACILRESLTP